MLVVVVNGYQIKETTIHNERQPAAIGRPIEETHGRRKGGGVSNERPGFAAGDMLQVKDGRRHTTRHDTINFELLSSAVHVHTSPNPNVSRFDSGTFFCFA